MGRRCCIAGCQSSSRLPEHQGVTYHSFPLDPAIRNVWLKNTHLSIGRQITKSVLVCSRHFRRADFNPMKNGKYLLKHRVFPTVFPWGKMDPAQVEADQELLKRTAGQPATAGTSAHVSPENTEDETKATVAATVAQILAETAELNAAAGLKASSTHAKSEATDDLSTTSLRSASTDATIPLSMSPLSAKFEPVTNFSLGARLEAQDFDGIWHVARVVEIDNDDREVLIRFERSGKVKTAVDGTEEWIPMNSNRLRQKVPNKPIPVFELNEKCMARWSGPRRFPGTVKKMLGNDMYEVLFDDGYVKNVRAIHMSKIQSAEDDLSAISGAVSDTATATVAAEHVTPGTMSHTGSPAHGNTETGTQSPATVTKKRSGHSSRKDWPLLDLSKLDLSTLNLPDIPHDGEWTCHWVNDQPIGKEGFLVVGEHRKPTVIVEDWRLPPGWVKHMYQRSNVLGKWDVILVSPSGKRFRSKSDLKAYLEEKGTFYNPDIYDFSIHRRRAKDINAYVFTPDYTPQVPKPKQINSTLDISAEEKSALASSLESSVLSKSGVGYMEAPIATATPPMELMTSPTNEKPLETLDINAAAENAAASTRSAAQITDATKHASPAPAPVSTVESGHVYIGGLQVQIVDNLFRCPEDNCSKHFRKENHVQIHIKHYHRHLAKLLGTCPKMLELAEKRTHNTTTTSEANEPTPKNQIPNQQFFAKLHQQDLEQSRSHRRQRTDPDAKPVTSVSTTKAKRAESPVVSTKQSAGKKSAEKSSPLTSTPASDKPAAKLASPLLDQSFPSNTTIDAPIETPIEEIAETASLSPKASTSRSRLLSPHSHRRTFGSRRSNRQRTTRRFLTAAQASLTSTPSAPALSVAASTSSAKSKTHSTENSFGSAADLEETRHSFNATPENKKRKHHTSTSALAIAPTTPLSSVDSPITADSGSSSLQHPQTPAANEDNENCAPAPPPKYIQENGEIIKIVRMRQTEIINCICGYGEEDGLMIQCELCFCWQHGSCTGIDKASEVPDKYVCYICRNPHRCRESMRFKYDQDWLYDGRLPTANYHRDNPNLPKRFDFLKRTHTVNANLLALKNFMHSLKIKIAIAGNRCHPKLYLWAKQWDDDNIDADGNAQETKANIKTESDTSPAKRSKLETPPVPNIPQPEAPIDPEECQHRLQKHIKVQQELVSKRLDEIEAQVEALENEDDLPDLQDADIKTIKKLLCTYMRDVDVMRHIATVNTMENVKKQSKQSQK